MNAYVKIRVVPNARKTCLEGLMDDGETFRIRLAAPPVDGKANEALLRWMTDTLNVKRAAISLTGGEKSRVKRVAVAGLSHEQVVECLQKSVETRE